MAEQLAAERDEVLFVGTPQGLEARLVPEAGVAFHGLPAKGFDRARPWTLVTSSLIIAASTLKAWALLGRVRPAVVIGFGGYVSIPVGFAALLRGVPLVLHEQNSVPGLANRVLSRWAKAAGVTYSESASLLAHPERALVTGNPVRSAVMRAGRAAGRESLGLTPGATVLLVFGGSRGARHINSAVVAVAPRLMSLGDVEVVHIAGRSEVEAVRAALREGGVPEGRWHLLDYVDEMGPVLASADLVLARAGATSIAEITALGLPSVLVPYPFATDDHQTTNARACGDHGAAVLVADSDLDDERFGDTLVALLCDAPRRASMADASKELGRPDAASAVVGLMRAVVQGDNQSKDPS